MKLERGGEIEDLKEYTGYSIQHIHRILNGERSKDSQSGKKIFKALEIMQKGREDVKKQIEKAMKQIDKEFKK